MRICVFPSLEHQPIVAHEVSGHCARLPDFAARSRIMQKTMALEHPNPVARFLTVDVVGDLGLACRSMGHNHMLTKPKAFHEIGNERLSDVFDEFD
jgi:hypothetical protein